MTSIGPFGAWLSGTTLPHDPDAVSEFAGELEDFGFDALWVGGASGDLKLPEYLLAGTRRLTVATGIVNIWRFPALEVAGNHRRLAEAYPGRFLLGIGVGHAPVIEEYKHPIAKLESYLDELDAASVPEAERLIAALRTRALQIAASRGRGAVPYLVPPEHSASARAVLGDGPLLAPSQKVIFETDPRQARQVAREGLTVFLQLPNYLNNLRQYGLSDDDFRDGGSDRFVDSVVAWGSEQVIRDRLQAHIDAGADHVGIQLLVADGKSPVMQDWKRLADLLGRPSPR